MSDESFQAEDGRINDQVKYHVQIPGKNREAAQFKCNLCVEQGCSSIIPKTSLNTTKNEFVFFSKEFFNGLKTLCTPSNFPKADEISINRSQVQFRSIDSMNFTKKSPSTNTLNLTNHPLNSGEKNELSILKENMYQKEQSYFERYGRFLHCTQ